MSRFLPISFPRWRRALSTPCPTGRAGSSSRNGTAFAASLSGTAARSSFSPNPASRSGATSPRSSSLSSRCRPSASCSTASWRSRSRESYPSTPCRCACIRPPAASPSLRGRRPRFSILFDMLLDARGTSLLDRPLTERRAALEAFHAAAESAPALRLSPYTRNRSQARAMARARRRRGRRRRRQAHRRTVRVRRARDAEGQALAHRRLRRRRLPLRHGQPRSRVAASRPLQ